MCPPLPRDPSHEHQQRPAVPVRCLVSQIVHLVVGCKSGGQVQGALLKAVKMVAKCTKEASVFDTDGLHKGLLATCETLALLNALSRQNPGPIADAKAAQLMAMGHYDAAEARLLECMRQDSGNPNLCYALGRLEQNVRCDQLKAKSWYTKALEVRCFFACCIRPGSVGLLLHRSVGQQRASDPVEEANLAVAVPCAAAVTASDGGDRHRRGGNVGQATGHRCTIG